MRTQAPASAILIGLSTTAQAGDVFLLCHADGAVRGFNVRVDLTSSHLTLHDQHRSRRCDATITAEYIEYFCGGMLTTRINRKSLNWIAWNYSGKTSGTGYCQKTDDQRRLQENICCDVMNVKPVEPIPKSDEGP